MKPRLAVVALAAMVVAAGSSALFRPGYSPDEEFTLFAVRGIHTHGLPLLPSGLLYDRGLLYSYVSWLAAGPTGLELPAFRAVSLLSAAGALVLGFTLVRSLASPPAAVLAASLVAASTPFWAVATTGRFYGPFLLAYLGVLAFVSRLCSLERASSRRAGAHPHSPARAAFHETSPAARDPTHLRSVRALRSFGEPRPPAPAITWLLLGALTFVCRLTHELAFTLMAVPAVGLALSWLEARDAASDREQSRLLTRISPTPRDWLAVAATMAAGLAAAQALLVSLHFVMPGGEGGTMIERFFVWQVLNLLERPQGAPLGVVLAALVVAWLLVPARAAPSAIMGMCAGAAVIAFALARAATATPFSVPLVQTVVASSLAYPLDLFWHLSSTHPVMLWAALGLLVLRLCGAGGAWPVGERAAHLGWVSWVLWFGVIDSGITVNYLLLPVVFMLAAVAIDLVAIGQQAAAVWPGPRAQVTRAALAGAALLVVADQWSGVGSLPQRLAAARPTIDVAGIEAIRNSLQPTDRVACTDELACLVLVGRVDYWLALDDYVRERFLVRRGSEQVGVYAGSPAALGPAGLFEPGADGAVPGRVIVVDVFKDYAVGNSAAWLPRAMDEDGTGFRTLLLTPQARVVEVVTPEN